MIAETLREAVAARSFPPAGPGLLVALDIDGTLMGHDGTIGTSVRQVVAELYARGAHVVLSTGRSIVGTTEVLAELGLTSGWAVCSNGAVTVRVDPSLPDGYGIEQVRTFHPRAALELVRSVMPGVRFAVEVLGRGFKVTEHFPPGELSGEVEVVPFEELCAEPASRVTLRAPHLDAEEFNGILSRSGLHGVNYAVGWSAWVDLAPEDVSKASALEELRVRLGVDAAATLSMGDGRNDIEMLRWAALGVAMGGAEAETREAADVVTGHVMQDGAVEVLRQLL